jgi:uncharacterized protein (DUF427 family)
MRPARRVLRVAMSLKPVLVPGRLHPITVERTPGRVTVTLGGRVVADSTSALTLTEASYPSVQYVPLADVDADVLVPSDHTSYCPFKGDATYYSLQVGDDVAPAAAWTYVDPHDAVATIKDHVAFYPDRVDAIEVHDA